MPYLSLGARTAQGTSTDSINWTVTFDSSVLSVSTTIPVFEVYHTTVSSVSGATFSRMLESWSWDSGIYGASNTDDPQQPMLVQPGQTITFKFTYKTANATPPSVTVWMRYNSDLLRVS